MMYKGLNSEELKNIETKLITKLNEFLIEPPYCYELVWLNRKKYIIPWFIDNINCFDDFDQIENLLRVTLAYEKRNNVKQFVGEIDTKELSNKTTKLSRTRKNSIKNLRKVKENLESIRITQPAPEMRELLSLIDIFLEDENKLIPAPIKFTENNRDRIKECLREQGIISKSEQEKYFRCIQLTMYMWNPISKLKFTITPPQN